MQTNSTGEGAPAWGPVEGIITSPSSSSVEVTVDRIEAAMCSCGLTHFALIDHSGEAGCVGLTMRLTKLVIFGGPTASTPVMVASPLLAHALIQS